MKFGVREICDVVLRAKSNMKVGKKQFYKNEPVLYFDTLTTSSLEGAATTSYANGGRGNARILAWEGERTLTFNMTDALISPESFAVLSGADVIDASEKAMYVHSTSRSVVEKDATDANRIYVEVPGYAVWNHTHNEQSTGDYYNAGADIFIMKVDGNDMSEPAIPFDGYADKDPIVRADGKSQIEVKAFPVGSTVLVDYYTKQTKGKQIEITPDKFGGYFYLEASTLFRDEETGQDLPAEFVIPRCKVQSNFTFTMASTGDPSTFDFVLDAFPDYTKFDAEKKVLAILQVVEDTTAEGSDEQTEREHENEMRPEYDSEASADAFDHKTHYDYHDSTYHVEQDDIASVNFKPGAKVTLGQVPVDEDIFGKTVGDIQNSLTISDSDVTVEPKFIEDWTAFSSIPAEQTGYYMAFTAEVEGADKVTVTIKRNGEWGGKPATALSAKETYAFFLGLLPNTAEEAEGIKVEGYKNNAKIGEKIYNLTVAVE